MQYEHYEEDIVLKHGVILEGWTGCSFASPSSLPTTLAPLRVLRNALRDGECKWRKLSMAEKLVKEKEWDAKVAKGEVTPRVRATRVDAGVSRDKRSVKAKGKTAPTVQVSHDEDNQEESRQRTRRIRRAIIPDSEDEEVDGNRASQEQAGGSDTNSGTQSSGSGDIDQSPVSASAAGNQSTNGTARAAPSPNPAGENAATPDRNHPEPDAAGHSVAPSNIQPGTDLPEKRRRKPTQKTHLGYTDPSEKKRKRSKKDDGDAMRENGGGKDGDQVRDRERPRPRKRTKKSAATTEADT